MALWDLLALTRLARWVLSHPCQAAQWDLHLCISTMRRMVEIRAKDKGRGMLLWDSQDDLVTVGGLPQPH